MRRFAVLILSLMLMMSPVACTNDKESDGNTLSEVTSTSRAEFVLRTTVVEVRENVYVVEDGVDLSGRYLFRGEAHMSKPDSYVEIKPGDVIECVYDGSIGETAPAVITHVYSAKVIGTATSE